MRDNSVTLEGNLTRDPEVKFTQSGFSMTDFGLAVNRSRKQGDEWVEEVSFFECRILESPLDENFADSLSKGDRVLLHGWFQQRNVEQDDGTKRSYLTFVVESGGPSLKWAKAVVTRNPKKGEGGKPAPGGDFFGSDEEPF
jgi:single-strand DNA-binding protein